MYNTNLSQVRSMLKLFNIVGLIFSIVLTFGILASLNQATSMGEPENAAEFALIVTALIAMCSANIYFTLIILNFVKNSSDDELIANRYILSVFSIGIQGIMTPFMLSNLPNMQTSNNNARMNPKFVIGKHYGMAGLVLSVITGGSLALYGQQFNVLNDSNVLITFYVLGGIGLVSLISLPLFWLKSSEESFVNKTGIYPVQIVFSIIALVIATITVVWIMLLAVLRLLQTISNAVNNRDNAFIFILSLMMVFLQFWYVQFIWTICISTLKGIWSSPNSDALEYKVYTKLDERKEYEAQQNNNR
ncbi:hypothetical protein STIUS_v1c02020 [Spiroplasma sp. TIUS-1]|uniref:hypothetical protein n=1 Tax=Spiroplasma sp. TIUS-1 TaxID=216963 RepID=UPI001399518E|nr:hypothetical protein [Spiroplasma sp. TIUS-1]QHX35757.1 hypothetical protein STIUS_v1c02020 [Spiroplasma sp. TIUS-1]